MIKVVELPTYRREVEHSTREVLNKVIDDFCNRNVQGIAVVMFDEDGKSETYISSTQFRSRLITGIVDLLFQTQQAERAD